MGLVRKAFPKGTHTLRLADSEASRYITIAGRTIAGSEVG